MNKIVKNTLILTLITVIAGFLLGAVSMQRSTKSVQQVMQDMSSQQQTKTDSAAISRLQLVLRKTVRSTVYLFFLSARQQVLV